VALVTLTKMPLFIWSRRRSCKILRGFGAISLILLARSDPIVEIEKCVEDPPTNSDNEVDLGLGWNVEVAGLAGGTLQANFLPLF